MFKCGTLLIIRFTYRIDGGHENTEKNNSIHFDVVEQCLSIQILSFYKIKCLVDPKGQYICL